MITDQVACGRRLFIGDFPDWSTNAAREHAKGIKREVDPGLDPFALRDGRRTAPTIDDLIERNPRLYLISDADYIPIITNPGDFGMSKFYSPSLSSRLHAMRRMLWKLV